MTRFTRCESSPSFPVIVVRSALPCHRTAPEKVTGRTGKRYQKGSGRAPEGFLNGRGTGARRVFTFLPPRTNTTTSVAILAQGQHALSASSRLQWSNRLRTRRQRRSMASQGATTPFFWAHTKGVRTQQCNNNRGQACNNLRLTPHTCKCVAISCCCMQFIVVAFFVFATCKILSFLALFPASMGCGAIVAVTTCCICWVAITCCCVQFLVVACNLLLFQDPAAPPTPLSLQQQQHYPHTSHIVMHIAHFATTDLRTAATKDHRASYGYAHSTSCVKLSRPSELSERNCEHVVDVSVPQVVGQLFVVPKISSQDRIVQRTVEHVSRCSRAAYNRTVCRSAEVRFSRQNPAADSRTDL